ncbi:MAG: haloacid dehalogenase-like hydrolase [Silanimonas sp.]
MLEAPASSEARVGAADVVVYDFDGTLVEGDIGAAFIQHLLRGWRRALALPIAPLAFMLMRFDATRASGVGLFLRIATVGRDIEDVDAQAIRFAEARTLRRRGRELAWLDADLAAGHRVVVATGAFETLARVVLHRLGLDGRVVLVASRLRPGRIGLGVARHCNGTAKVHALIADGFPPPYAKAVSDSWADAPLLAAAHDAVLVNASPVSRATLRREIGPRLVDADAHPAPAAPATDR